MSDESGDEIPGIIVPIKGLWVAPVDALKRSPDAIAFEGGDLNKPDQAFLIYYKFFQTVQLFGFGDGITWRLLRHQDPTGLDRDCGIVKNWVLKKVNK